MIAHQEHPERRKRREAFLPPKQRLTAEGWYYLLVIAFIVGGAVLREVNLLVLLAGLMIGPLLWNWLLARWALRRVTATEVPLARAHVGETLTASWLLHNQDAKLAAWGVVVDEGVRQPGVPGYVRSRIVAPCLAPGRTVRVSYRLVFPQRGLYELGPLKLSTSFPLGLVRTSALLRRRRTVTVWPALGKLQPSWQAMLRQAQLGQRTSQPRKGRLEGDYYGLREWRPGDSRRWIHWRTTARLNALTVRQFEQRRDEALTLVVDLWAPRDDPASVRDQVESALRFVATIIEDRRRRGEHEVQMVLRGKETESWRGVVKSTMAARILDALAVAQPHCDSDGSPGDEWWGQIDLRQRNLIVISTRPRPAVAPAGVSNLLWIGPDDYGRWFEDSLGSEPETADVATPASQEVPTGAVS